MAAKMAAPSVDVMVVPWVAWMVVWTVESTVGRMDGQKEMMWARTLEGSEPMDWRNKLQ